MPQLELNQTMWLPPPGADAAWMRAEAVEVSMDCPAFPAMKFSSSHTIRRTFLSMNLSAWGG